MQLLVSFKLLRAKIILGFFPLAFFLITKPQQSWWKLYKNSLIYKQFEFEASFTLNNLPHVINHNACICYDFVERSKYRSIYKMIDLNAKQQMKLFNEFRYNVLQCYLAFLKT